MKAADATLRLSSDYCLTAAGTGNGAAVLVRDCAGTGTGGAVTGTAKQWTYNTSTHALVNEASGRCLDVSGSDSTRVGPHSISGTATAAPTSSGRCPPRTDHSRPRCRGGLRGQRCPALSPGIPPASVFSHARWVIDAFRCGDHSIGRRRGT
ncbi:ricin-type beta-trefoil lectin domain protein [Streptomyces sp. NPDC005181]|uniref:ricin-type beta-trefoil lectin domain protein n=1 Tax=Streptomyces sp. NPDC005181 TaxID=3156869 RepID=UPI0033B0A92E